MNAHAKRVSEVKRRAKTVKPSRRFAHQSYTGEQRLVSKLPIGWTWGKRQQ